MKPLTFIFGIVGGAFVGVVLGIFSAGCAGLLSMWAHPEDASAGSAADIGIVTVLAGAVLGAAFGAYLITTRPRLFLMTVVPLAILILGLWLTITALQSYDVPRNYLLKVTGTPGADFLGEVRVDGEFQKLNGRLPAEFEYQAIEVEFAFGLPDAKEGEKIEVVVLIDGKRKWHVKMQSETRFAGKYKSFGYSDSPRVLPLGGTEVWGESDLLPEHRPAPPPPFRK